MLAATGRWRRALTRRLANIEGRSEAFDSSVECLICLASAFDMPKAKSKWFQCRAGHLLCETCCNTVSGTAPCSACTLPMGASLTTSMGSIRCRALEAVVEMLLLDVEETRDAACQADGWIEADQTTSCPTLTGDIAESTVAWAGDEGGDCTWPVPLAALARAPRYVPQEQLLPASGCDQASPLTSLQDRNELVSTAPPSLPTLQPSLMRVEPAAAHALGEPVEPLVPAIEQVEDLPTNLQERDELGNTALHLASKRGRADTVRRLIESGGKALLFATTWNGRTALHDAAARGQADVVGLLCDAGGCELLWVANADGNTALHLAACGGHCAVLELLVEAGGKELLFAKNLKGHTALHSASVKGRMEASRLLAAAGGKELLLFADAEGNTALHLAAHNGHVAVLEHLAEAGGKELLFAKNFKGRSALHQASIIDLVEAARVLAAAGGKELLLACDADGDTTIHLAAAYGHVGMLELLVEAGGEELLFAKGFEGRSALHAASSKGHVEAARVLAAAGGKDLLLVVEDDGNTALVVAAQYGHVGVVELLLEAGGKELLFAKSLDGLSALHEASIGGCSGAFCRWGQGASLGWYC